MELNKIYKDEWINVLKKIEDNSIDLICGDPPYGINYNKNEWDNLNSFDPFIFFGESFSKLKKNGNLIVFSGWSNINRLLNAYENLLLHGMPYLLKNIITWDRQKTKNGGLKNFTSAAEFILWITKGDHYTFNKEDSKIVKKTKGGYGTKNGSIFRRTSNVWTGISPIHYKSKEYTGYDCQKPLALMQKIIRIFSNPGDTVLDLFCGSGSTLEAAKIEGRNYIGGDSSDEAIKISTKRLEKYV